MPIERLRKNAERKAFELEVERRTNAAYPRLYRTWVVSVVLMVGFYVVALSVVFFFPTLSSVIINPLLYLFVLGYWSSLAAVFVLTFVSYLRSRPIRAALRAEVNRDG